MSIILILGMMLLYVHCTSCVFYMLENFIADTVLTKAQSESSRPSMAGPDLRHKDQLVVNGKYIVQYSQNADCMHNYSIILYSVLHENFTGYVFANVVKVATSTV